MNASVCERFFELARQEPDARFLMSLERSCGARIEAMRRRECANHVINLVGQLLQHGVEPGDKVVVNVGNDWTWVVLDLACQLMGAVSVVVHPSVDRKAMERIAAQTNARLVVSTHVASAETGALWTTSERIASALVERRDERGALVDVPAFLARLDPGALATIMYTSGSTGVPKGVMLTHGALASNAFATARALGLQSEDVIPAVLSFSHSAGRTALLHTTIVAGATIALLDQIDVSCHPGSIEALDPTVLVLVPRVLERLASWYRDSAAVTKKLPRLRTVLVGGASLAAATGAMLEAAGVQVCEAYGCTEATCTVTMNRSGAHQPGSVGRPLDGVAVRIARDGEVLCRGDGIMLGFWHDRPSTEGVLDADGWLATGDLGVMDGDGYLHIVGRKKDTFVTGDGNHVAPARLEGLLEAVPEIAESIVCGDGRPFLAAVLVPDFDALRRDGAEPHASCPRAPICDRSRRDMAQCARVRRWFQDTIDARVNEHLQPYERIHRVALLPERFPSGVRDMTPTAKVKVDRQQFAARYVSVLADLYPGTKSLLAQARSTFRVPADALLAEVARVHTDWTHTGSVALEGPTPPASGDAFPEEGTPAAKVVEQFCHEIARDSRCFASKNYVAHMVSAVPTVGIAAEALMAVLNQNQVSFDASPITSIIERRTVRWLAQLVGYDPEVAGGLGAAGGSIANITALLAARNRASARGPEDGLRAASQDGVVLVSERMHYSFRRAADLLGLGAERGVVPIPVDGTHRVALGDLKRLLDRLDRQHRPVIAIAAIAGTSETGNIDPIEAMAEIAAERELWLHVDAALGAAALCSDRHRARFAGIERAHSITIDPHKWFYVPYQCAFVLFREQGLMQHVELSNPDFVVLRDADPDLGKWSLEGSRAANAVKFWMVARNIGRRGYAALVDHQVDLTSELATMVDLASDLERLTVPELNILCFRYAPESVRSAAGASGSPHERLRNAWLDELNVALHRQLASQNRVFLSRTKLQSSHGVSVVALRAVLFHPDLEREDLAHLLRTVRERGRQVAANLPPYVGVAG